MLRLDYCARPDVFSELAVVVPKIKVLFSAIPSSGNTSVKLALSRLIGIPKETYERSEWPHSVAAAGIHNISAAPWSALDSKEWSLPNFVGNDPGWFWFTVVRNPVMRVFSSWVNLVLLRDPHLEAIGLSEVEYPKPPDTWEAIPDLFEKFLKSREFPFLAANDVHFAPQAQLLPPRKKGNKMEIFHIEDENLLVSAVNQHLEGSGRRFVLEKEHTGVLRFGDFDWGGTEVVSLCLEYFSEDFEMFGYSTRTENYLQGRDHVPTAGSFVEALRARNERILILSRLLAEEKKGESYESREASSKEMPSLRGKLANLIRGVPDGEG